MEPQSSPMFLLGTATMACHGEEVSLLVISHAVLAVNLGFDSAMNSKEGKSWVLPGVCFLSWFCFSPLFFCTPCVPSNTSNNQLTPPLINSSLLFIPQWPFWNSGPIMLVWPLSLREFWALKNRSILFSRKLSAFVTKTLYSSTILGLPLDD